MVDDMNDRRLPVWQPERQTTKLAILAGVIIVTLGIHTGWLVDPIFGHIHWLHEIHGRFCYIPIVVAAAWFGLRGGLLTALIISLGVLPYVLGANFPAAQLTDEITEIVFYFAIALLAGGLVEREFRSRRRAEEMRLQLERSQKMSLVGSIAAGMAHEIKNPLASIKGAVEILSDDTTEATERDEFKAIVFKEVKRINASVTDFLEFARPSESKLEQLNLSEVVHSCIKQVRTQARERGIEIRDEIAADVVIQGDAEKIHQVMLNLILNAIDASTKNSPISVSLAVSPGSSTAEIAIADNGAGIDDKDLPKIFEPFYTTKSSGTGLGLSIARNIVEQHGGRIQLSNRAEGGALASISLPLDAAREGGGV